MFRKVLNSSFFYPISISIWIFFLSFYNLGNLEFFRHTEADRTLIAMEMLESGQYVVPHLLYEPILTKPPVYYWMSAISLSLFSEPSEFAARSLNAFISIFFVLLQYFSTRAAGLSRFKSAGAAIVFATGFNFFMQSVVAEIDLLFSFLTTFSLYLCCFSIIKNSFKLTLVSYLVAGKVNSIRKLPVNGTAKE